MADEHALPVVATPLPNAETTTEEWVRKIVKGALNAIPLGGGLLAEIVDGAWIPAHAKKMHEWYEYVDATIRILVHEGKLTVDQLYGDERFASLFQKTTRIYLENVEAFKRPSLQAALKSSLVTSLPLDKKYIFLRILDELSEVQLLILQDVYYNSISENYHYQARLEQQLTEKYAGGDSQYFSLLKKGLEDFHLIGYGSADVVVDGVNQLNMVASNIAIDFLQYISPE